MSLKQTKSEKKMKKIGEEHWRGIGVKINAASRKRICDFMNIEMDEDDKGAAKQSKFISSIPKMPLVLAGVSVDQPHHSQWIFYAGTAEGWATLGQFGNSVTRVLVLPHI